MNKIELENVDTGEIIVLTENQKDRFFDNRDPSSWKEVDPPSITEPAVSEVLYDS